MPVGSARARRPGAAAAAAASAAAAAGLADGERERGSGSAALAEDRYAEALERWLALGGPDIDARSEEVCDDLALDAGVLDQDMDNLSGGQASRVSLAAILLTRADVLLLDEPTNDLDFDGLARLERFVAEHPGPAVVVSHDRAFLERTVTDVLELDEHRRRGQHFSGGWLAYLDERATARRHAEESYERFRSTRQDLVDRSRRTRQWADKGFRRATRAPDDGDKFVRHRNVAMSEKIAAKAARLDRAVERLDEVDKPWEGWRLELELAAAPRSGDVVARLDGAMVQRDGFRLGPIDLEIRWADRLAVLGPNGSGKTTLIDLILGRVAMAAGERWLGPGVVVGELDQARRRFLDDRSLLEGFLAVTGSVVSDARSLLAKFGLDAAAVDRPALSLSPGERTRAALALLMAGGTNCLVLDEPTNHLDLPAIEQLEQALAGWRGTLLLVTHDRRFLDAVTVDRVVDLGSRSGPGRG